jgi:hypothetical protein
MSGRARTLWAVAGVLCAAGVVVAAVVHDKAARWQERRAAVLGYLQRTIARKDVETLGWTKESRGKGVSKVLPDREAHQAWELLMSDWAHVKVVDGRSRTASKVANFTGPYVGLDVRIRGKEGNLVEAWIYAREGDHVIVTFNVVYGPYVGVYYLENPAPSQRVFQEVVVKVRSLVPAPNP